MRGDAGTAADRAVLGRDHRRRHRRWRGCRWRTAGPALRPGRQRCLAGHLPLCGLRARRHRPRDGHRPAARRRGLDLADGGADRTRAEFLAPSGTVTRVASESFGGMDGRARQRRDRGPRLLDAARPDRTAARRGVGRAAVHGGRTAAGPGGRRRDAQPARPTRLDDRAATTTLQCPSPTSRRSRSSRRRRLCWSCATALPSGRDARGARRDVVEPSPPAPARSRSTPSEPRATATPIVPI